MNIKAVWNEGRSFVATAPGLDPVIMEWGDNRKQFSPMELLLASLAGCTGVDVVDILTKMREEITRVEVNVEAHRREEHPRIWKAIVVHYDIYGKGVSEEKAARAVSLSVEKYCSVSAMFSKEVSLTHEFKIREA